MLTDLFQIPIPLAEKIVRSLLVYFALVILLRVFGKRELAQLSPFDLIVLLSFAAQFAIAAYFFYLLYWLFELPQQDGEAPALPADLPRVLLQIPVFNEPLVTEQSLRCVALLDWPKDKLRIQLLDDSTDETTERAAAASRR